MKQNNRAVSFLKMFKGLFFVSLLLIFFTIPALSAETGTSTIHYYFDLEARGHSSGGSVIEPEEPDKPSCPPCALATLTQNPDTCECYCGKSLSDCLEDEVFNASQCRCEQCPGNQVVIDGVCGCAPCSQENYVLDEADCSCNCGLTASDCVSGESYLVDDIEGCRCVACGSSSQTGLICPVADGVDANGCLVYREKTQADCGVGLSLVGCTCVIQNPDGSICDPAAETCVQNCPEPEIFECENDSSNTCSGGQEWKEVGQHQVNTYQLADGTQCYNIQKECKCVCPSDKPVELSGMCFECASDADCNPDKPYCNTSSNNGAMYTCVSCLSAQDCNINGSDGYVCEKGQCKCEGIGSWIGGKICCSFDVCTNFDTQKEICYKNTESCCISGNAMWISDSSDCGTQPPECDDSIMLNCWEETALCQGGTSETYRVCETQCGNHYTEFTGC